MIPFFGGASDDPEKTMQLWHVGQDFDHETAGGRSIDIGEVDFAEPPA